MPSPTSLSAALMASMLLTTPAMSTTYEEQYIGTIGSFARFAGSQLMHDGSVIVVTGEGGPNLQNEYNIQRFHNGKKDMLFESDSAIHRFKAYENGHATWTSYESFPSGEVIEKLNYYDGEAIHELDRIPQHLSNSFITYVVTQNGHTLWESETVTDIRQGTRSCALKYFDGSTIKVLNDDTDCSTTGVHYNDQGQAIWYDYPPETARNTEVSREVYLFDGASTKQLTTTNTPIFTRSTPSSRAKINNHGQAAWRSIDEQGKYGLSLYAENNITELTHSADSLYHVMNNNNQIAWVENENALYFYESETVLHIPTQGEIHNLRLNDSGWLSWRNENYDIYRYKEGEIKSHMSNTGLFARYTPFILKNGDFFVPFYSEPYSPPSPYRPLPPPPHMYYYDGTTFKDITGIVEGESRTSGELFQTKSGKAAWPIRENIDTDLCMGYAGSKRSKLHIFDGETITFYKTRIDDPCTGGIRVIDMNEQGDILITLDQELGTMQSSTYELILLKATP